MNTDDIILVANAAIQELGLTDSQTYYIDGVLTMAMILRAEEYETQLGEMDKSLLRLVTCSNELQGKLEAMTRERDKLLTAYNSSELARNGLRIERDVMQKDLAAMTAERDALIVQRASYLRGDMIERGEIATPSTGRIHYAAAQPGHLET